MAKQIVKLCYSAVLYSFIIYFVLYSASFISFAKDAYQPFYTISEEASAASHALPAATHSNTAVEEVHNSAVEEDVTNSTLGFQKIVAISLPERVDRRNLLKLMSKNQDIEIEWMDAVRGEDLPNAARPKSWNVSYEDHKLTTGEIGNWKSHINVLQKVVDSGYTSALILEDDADWDLTLKSQLRDFAHAARNIESRRHVLNGPLRSTNQSLTPYGSTWDLLPIGICANPPGPADAEIIPGVEGEQHYVYPVDGGIACTYAYGVSKQSARLLLEYLEDTNCPTDIAISNFCANPNINCLIVWPMLISSHKAAGSQSKDSDIGHNASEEEATDTSSRAEEDKIREKGETWKIAHSAIMDTLEKANNSQTSVN